MNPRYLFLLSLLFLLVQPLSAQRGEDWLTGYIVDNDGDTLHGLVRDRDTGPFGGLLPKVQVKPEGKRKKKFKPQQIQSYGRGNSRFITLQVVTTSQLLRTETRIVDRGGESQFFQVIAEGGLNLYHQEFTDEDNFRIDFIPYFNKAGDDELVRATQGLFGLKKKLLSRYFSDRPDLVEKIRRGELKTPMDVVEAYGTNGE